MKLDIHLLRSRPANETGLPAPGARDFIAIDVETANSSRASICAIGVAVVQGGRITEVGSTLINPECEFSPYNTAVHGLDDDDIAHAPTLPEAWPQIAALLDGVRLVAHYASFDIGALRASAARYGLPGVNLKLYCTWRIARRVWDQPSYGLGYLAPRLGIDFDHHVAGSDAIACAQVALAAYQAVDVPDMETLAETIGFIAGRLTPQSFEPASFVDSGPLRSLEGNTDADPEHPFFGQTLCFTGAMFSMVRREAAEQVVGVGADFVDNMSGKVNFLVLGDADYVAFADGWTTGKLAKAIKLKDKGKPVEIISERDFIRLLLS